MEAKICKTIEVTRRGIPPRIDAVQGDTGRQIAFVISDMAVPDTAAAKVYLLKPDGHHVYNDGTLSTVDGLTTVTVPLTSQALAAVGRATGQVQLLDGESLVTSFDFLVEIVPARADGEAVESTNEFLGLVGATNAANQAAEDANTAAEAANQAKTGADAAAKAAQQATTKANTAATAAQKAKTDADAAATAANNAGQAANQAASGANNAAQSANQAAANANAAAQAANQAAEDANAVIDEIEQGSGVVLVADTITDAEIDAIMEEGTA